MQSILIVSKDNKKTEQELSKITQEIDKLDINVLDYQLNPLDSRNKTSIGINEVRDFQKKLFLKPIKSKKKGVILRYCELLTIEAQNALLKVLEEPPDNTIIILASSNKNIFLPTILSRVKIIELKDEFELKQEEISQYLNISISLLSSKTGDRLELAQDLSKNKEGTIIWLEKMILTVRHILLFSFSNTFSSSDLPGKAGLNQDIKKHLSSFISHLSSPQLLNILMSLTRTHTILSTTNANPRLTLENLFLNL